MKTDLEKLSDIERIIEYNEEMHFLDGKENETIDETEVNEYLKWYNQQNICKNCSFDMGEGYVNCGLSPDGICPNCGTDDKKQVPTKNEIIEYMELHNADEVGINNQWTFEDAEYHLLLSDEYNN